MDIFIVAKTDNIHLLFTRKLCTLYTKKVNRKIEKENKFTIFMKRGMSSII